MRRSWTMLVASLAVVATSSAVGGAAAVAGAPPGAISDTRIAFVHCAPRCQIYTSNPDGSSIQKVTRTGGPGASGPDWSPDGTQLVYENYAGRRPQIWIIDADGTHAHQLTHVGPDHNAYWPAFTPDGTHVVYTDCLFDFCDGGISIVRVDGTHEHAITPNSGPSFNDASMSPDGTKLVYQRWHVGGVTSALYISREDGTGERRLTAPWLLAYTPEWRPDGRRIAFASNLYGDRVPGSIYTIAQNGTGLVRVTHPPSPALDQNPSYAPAGDRIVFESDRLYTDGRHSLFLVNADGTGLSAIPLPWDAYTPSWGTAPAIP